MARRRCLACGNVTGQGQRLCTTCKLGLTKYPEQNPAIVTAYVRGGLAELEHLLLAHARFDAWLRSPHGAV